MPDPTPPARLRERLSRLLELLEEGLVERRREVRLLLLAALAGEHSLLLGPPGTAKSELARRLHRAFREASYFERLLTRFSVPEELFGPLSIRALEEDRYERHLAGFLPEASIAFIDEVFKANSAILNALLTLLNEREFDNGAGRIRCPLISAVAASNEVPEDEVAAAFFDRFLVRIPVAPVSSAGFARLLALPPSAAHGEAYAGALDAADRGALGAAAAAVAIPDEIALRLGELRGWLAGEGLPASDRRWVKIAALLKTAAAAEGRAAVSRWDLTLLPACLGADAATQQRVAEWIGARLGVDEGLAPARLTRSVAAFEGQLLAEQNADDLDYDDHGRLRLGAAEIAGTVNDAKGGAQALRMTYTRRRRYGQTHIDARVSQLDGLQQRLAACTAEVAALRAELEHQLAGSLWLDAAAGEALSASLGASAQAVEELQRRARIAREGFLALPRLEHDPCIEPAPVEAAEP